LGKDCKEKPVGFFWAVKKGKGTGVCDPIIICAKDDRDCGGAH